MAAIQKKILTDQSKGDASLTEEIEKNVTNERKGEGSINEDTNITGKELEGVTNESEGNSEWAYSYNAHRFERVT